MRLRTVADDAAFVAEIAALWPALPLVANLRCGLWYALPLVDTFCPPFPSPLVSSHSAAALSEHIQELRPADAEMQAAAAGDLGGPVPATNSKQVVMTYPDHVGEWNHSGAGSGAELHVEKTWQISEMLTATANRHFVSSRTI